MAGSVSPDGILQLGLGFWGSKALLSAVELGVCTELASGPKDLAGLTAALGLHPRSARDFFDALVALRIIDRQGGMYVNSAEADRYLDRGKPTYLGGLLEMCNARLYGFWGHLTDALRTGQPQNEIRQGEDLFGALYADPKRLEAFLKAMSGISIATAGVMAAAFPWQEFRSFVDVGCAQGGCSTVIAAAHPHLSGIGFDLPPVRPIFEAYAAERGLADRLRFQAGDFFADPLPSADVVIMGHILHDWDLPKKQMLLAKAYEALPPGGAVIVYEALIDDDRRENAFGLLMSLNMLIETQGGFDFTGADCIGWMRLAGFREATVRPLNGPNSMVIGRK